MAELAVNQLIKIILGVLVIAAVAGGTYYIFKNDIFTFFDTLNETASIKIILGMLR